ncbi:CCHC-type domain-containing protein [Abeliophyllum distichum]|uniref:CCHC-type domain-containing protein n=1 Tax=Abeliophyllum distichum TaxID=126358 RepID=A0ABD1PD94_9LAMI
MKDKGQVYIENASKTNKKMKSNKYHGKAAKRGRGNNENKQGNWDKSKNNDKCLIYGKIGHRKRNCKAYLATMKGIKLTKTYASSIFVIKVILSTSLASWVFDTRCRSHICKNM